MNYSIGQKVETEERRRLMGEEFQGRDGSKVALWFVLKVQPMKEFEVEMWLGQQEGVLEAWLPTNKAWRNQARGHRRKVQYRQKIAPGYVFACVERRIAWDLLQRRSNGKVLGVVGYNGRPLPVPEEQMRAMKKLPKIVQKIYAEAQSVKLVRPGDKARILDDGPMCDWVVDVTEVNGGIAKILVPLLGEREAQISMEQLERIQE
ncbi:transcription antitermination protein NusG [Roseobacter sp. SK209-2-6]|uniref:transcription termination/antitermination NusG family protein n=1 Tax=Roseobacter sp. SK209-2-6 TaxID=388739 RepID=UPI0000F3C52D|nr:transcription termination/antitermination NusG family protein [Roseobacter sp. SK209-2-6]EBA18384.1 transcription antitermination protein NusG [Roseobacter sp. SK209-2-6]